jgi:NAD(P)-dependent dehydrogenase (short-subunit alcohol dehydrogenase family)
MSATPATELLRSGLLEGVSLLLARAGDDAGAQPGSLADAVRACATGLGARVLEALPIAPGSARAIEEVELEAQLDSTLAAAASVDMLVVDAAGMYAAAALGACLEASWNVTRALANRAFLAPTRPGRIVYLAPAPAAGEHAEAARAGLENLARTLSIEWARHDVTAVAISPGDHIPPGEVAALVAYLASPAGSYFSGCLLDLRGTPAATSAVSPW